MHPLMPEKPVNVRAITFPGIIDVCDGDEPVRGKLLHKLDHIPTRDMKLFTKMVEGRPCVPFSTCEVGQIGVKLLRFFRNLGALLKPLWQPNAMEQTVGIETEETAVAVAIAGDFSFHPTSS